MDLSYLTAIKRHKLSGPAQCLLDKGLLVRRILDYGSGRGDDARNLHALGLQVASYDPHYAPKMPGGLFDTIMCNFVLNVISDPLERSLVMLDINQRLRPGGIAYLTVRDDRRALNGWTSKGTWQGLIELLHEVVEHRRGRFKIYKMPYAYPGESDRVLRV